MRSRHVPLKLECFVLGTVQKTQYWKLNFGTKLLNANQQTSRRWSVLAAMSAVPCSTRPCRVLGSGMSRDSPILQDGEAEADLHHLPASVWTPTTLQDVSCAVNSVYVCKWPARCIIALLGSFSVGTCEHWAHSDLELQHAEQCIKASKRVT